MVEHHVAGNGQSVIKKAFLYQLCLLVVVVINLGELLVVKRNVVPLYEIVVEVDW